MYVAPNQLFPVIVFWATIMPLEIGVGMQITTGIVVFVP
jgi:hypothetical protein